MVTHSKTGHVTIPIRLTDIEPVRNILAAVGDLLEAVATHGAPPPVRAAAMKVADQISNVHDHTENP